MTVENSDGNAQTLCLSDYLQCVDPILHTTLQSTLGPVTCSASGCHDTNAGSGGGFKVHPNPDPDDPDQVLANYVSAKAFANLNTPANSKLLLEPLQGVFAISGVHTGGDIFPDRADACYLAMQDWISRRVGARDDQSCGGCTPPTLSSCGQ